MLTNGWGALGFGCSRSIGFADVVMGSLGDGAGAVGHCVGTGEGDATSSVLRLTSSQNVSAVASLSPMTTWDPVWTLSLANH